MKLILSLIFSLTVQTTFAKDFDCEISESLDQKQTTYLISLPVTNNSHGDIRRFQLQLLPELTVMLAVMKNIAVIHFTNDQMSLNTTSHSDLSGTGKAYAQYIITADVAKSVVISCELKSELDR